MRTEVRGSHEVVSSNGVVWINDIQGMCIGRFSHWGIDIHHGTKKQMEGEHCIKCSPGRPTLSGWNEFVLDMEKLHGVTISAIHRPVWVKENYDG